MSIGNNIYNLRTAKNLSQGALADLLDVSRQSVSKWETDAAIPDLDKLMKLCDIFGVSLDELTGRETVKSEINEPSKPETKTSPAQKIIGYILFSFSLLLGLITLVFGHNEGDYIFLLPIALSILICGLLCLFAGKKALYWCIWTIFAPITVLSPHLIRLSLVSILSAILLMVSVIMIFVANIVFKETVIKTTPQRTVVLILAWSVPIVLFVFEICIHTTAIPMPPYLDYDTTFSILLGFICYVLIAVLETYTVCYIKNARRKK